jgi:hypothetical protein
MTSSPRHFPNLYLPRAFECLLRRDPALHGQFLSLVSRALAFSPAVREG